MHRRPATRPERTATAASPRPGLRTARLLEDLESSLPAEGLRSRERRRAGDAIAELIVAAAEGVGAEVLVVGNNGMRGRKEFLLGNVANRVTHLAPARSPS